MSRLDTAGFADAALADKVLAHAVADHKSVFFAEKGRDGELVDYHTAVSGALCLVPSDAGLITLATDYQHMVDDGLFVDEVESFDALLRQRQSIQDKANAG